MCPRGRLRGQGRPRGLHLCSSLCGTGLIAESKLGYVNEVLLFLIDAFGVYSTKVAVTVMIFWLSPHHRNCKPQTFPLFLCPLP